MTDLAPTCREGGVWRGSSSLGPPQQAAQHPAPQAQAPATVLGRNTSEESSVRYCQVLSGIVRYYQVLSGIVRYCQVLSGCVRYCQVLSGIVRYSQVLSVTVKYRQVWVRSVMHFVVVSCIKNYHVVQINVKVFLGIVKCCKVFPGLNRPIKHSYY